jgi:hypothetical protein
MAYVYNTHAAFEEKMRYIQHIKSLQEPKKEARPTNLNHKSRLADATTGTEILTRMFNLDHRLVTQKVKPLPKCSRSMLVDRKRGPFLEGGIFLVKADTHNLSVIN